MPLVLSPARILAATAGLRDLVRRMQDETPLARYDLLSLPCADLEAAETPGLRGPPTRGLYRRDRRTTRSISASTSANSSLSYDPCDALAPLPSWWLFRGGARPPLAPARHCCRTVRTNAGSLPALPGTSIAPGCGRRLLPAS